jgi:hypothetical protein
MPRLSLETPAHASLLRSVVKSVASLITLAFGQAGKYHPEEHYMRGPGPKWRAKHFLDPASSANSR